MALGRLSKLAKTRIKKTKAIKLLSNRQSPCVAASVLKLNVQLLNSLRNNLSGFIALLQHKRMLHTTCAQMYVSLLPELFDHVKIILLRTPGVVASVVKEKLRQVFLDDVIIASFYLYKIEFVDRSIGLLMS